MAVSWSPAARAGRDGTLRFFNALRFAPLEELTRTATARVKHEWTPGERQRYFHEPPAR